MTKNIPVGYQLQINTWENDGDNWNTDTLNGLTREDITFYLDICNLFAAEKTHQEGWFGNGERDDENLKMFVERMADVISRHPNISTNLKEDWEIGNHDAICDLTQDLVGSCGDGEYWRVFESAVVYYFPEEIQDITSQFIKD